MDLLGTFKNNHVLALCPSLLEGDGPAVGKRVQTIKFMKVSFSAVS